MIFRGHFHNKQMLTKMDIALCFFPLLSMNLLWYAEKYIPHVITGDVGLASSIPRIESKSLHIVAADNTSFCCELTVHHEEYET